VVLAATVLGVAGGTAAALTRAPAQPAQTEFVDVVKVSGYLDPVLVDFVTRSIDAADRGGSAAIVLQLDSQGSVVSDGALDELLAGMKAATIPVGVWVGPSGATAFGGAARLLDAADYVAVAPGSTIEVDDRHMGAAEAQREGIADFAAPTLGDFIVNVPGVETKQVTRNGQPRREPVTPVRFTGLTLLEQLFHTVASPAVAYLLFVIGLGLILFEFFTAGVGVAGVVGAGSFVLGCYGLAVLPTTLLGVGLLLLAMFGFAVDVQTGVPRVWTGIATVSFVVGSLVLYDGIRLSWITLLVSIVGMVVAMLAGMPAMVRSRFSTPTIGREWMVGETGTAVRAIDPDGVVSVRDAPWRARTNRATPIAAGQQVRVASIEGLVLEVEPLDGAARDYRDRR
jgi:membrane-bound serine protease (ClpP class)